MKSKTPNEHSEKPRKYRPRNGVRSLTKDELESYGFNPLCKIHKEFTGAGEEAISGDGGGILYLTDGKLVRATMPIQIRKRTIEDMVKAYRARARLGAPPIESESAELANALLEAVGEGDSEQFNRIADVIKNPELPCDASLLPGSRRSQVFDAVCKAATNAGCPPTREQVRDVLASLTDNVTGTKLFLNPDASDKLQKMLENIGFGWLPHNKRGERAKRRKFP